MQGRASDMGKVSRRGMTKLCLEFFQEKKQYWVFFKAVNLDLETNHVNMCYCVWRKKGMLPLDFMTFNNNF